MKLRRTLLLALVAAVVAGPAAAIAIAGNGPSAGDNQYTDPLATSTKSTTSAPPPSNTTTPAASAPSTPATPVPTTSSGGPTATIASSSSTKDPKKTLPLTGYDGWAAALLGAGMLGAGFVVRRRLSAR